MIAIVISACLVGDPGVCKDYRIPLAYDVDPSHCMMDAQPHFAAWAEQPSRVGGSSAGAARSGDVAGSLIASSARPSGRLDKTQQKIKMEERHAARAHRFGPCSRPAARAAAAPCNAQDMIDQLDLKSDEFTKADMTRDDVLAAIAAAKATASPTCRASASTGSTCPGSISGSSSCSRAASTTPSSSAPTSTASCSIRRGRSIPTSPTPASRGRASSPRSSGTPRWTAPTSRARASPPTSRAPA